MINKESLKLTLLIAMLRRATATGRWQYDWGRWWKDFQTSKLEATNSSHKGKSPYPCLNFRRSQNAVSKLQNRSASVKSKIALGGEDKDKTPGLAFHPAAYDKQLPMHIGRKRIDHFGGKTEPEGGRTFEKALKRADNDDRRWQNPEYAQEAIRPLT